MRRGELLELRWRDWDPETATIRIRRSVGLIRTKGEGAELKTGPTKGGTSRVIRVDPQTAGMLKSRKAERGTVSLALAGPDALIFGDIEGQHLHPEHFSRTFQQTAARCRTAHPDLPAIRLHDLRYTHATILQGRGVASDAAFPGRCEVGAVRAAAFGRVA